MSIFDKATNVLWRSLRTAARTGIYNNGFGSVQVQAVPGTQTHDEYDNEGLVITRRSHDWIFKATDLVINGGQVLPAQYDRFIVDGVIYEVVKRADDKTFRYADEGRILVRAYFEVLSEG